MSNENGEATFGKPSRQPGRAQQPDATQGTRVEDLVHELEVHQIELELQNEELQVTQRQLEEALTRYRNLYDLAPVGYATLGPDGRVINANLTLAEMLRTGRETLVGSNLHAWVARDQQDQFFSHLRATFRDTSRRQRCEIELCRVEGGHFLAQFESISRGSENRPPDACLAVVTDVTERRRNEEIIHRQANFDQLTGLPNRTLFLDRLDFMIRDARREGTWLGLFYIDLDSFKWVNDTHGHQAGDEVLKEAARRFGSCARENDTVARLSGDEFCMLLPRINGASAACLVANKVLATMGSAFELCDGSSLHLGCSIGIAIYPGDCDGAGALMRGADLALLQAKRSGRGRFALYAHELNQELLRRQRLGLELKDAISHDNLVMQYQPIIELSSGRACGAEALVRWQHPRHGLLQPTEFIAIAETNGAIVGLGEWVLRAIHAQGRAWHDQGLPLDIIWVNLSAAQCGDVDRAARLTRLLSELNTWSDLPRIGLEITESDVVELSDSVLHTFSALHRRGVSLSIDDFGTGLSSLSRLLNLTFDVIKIDKSFVANLVSSKKSRDLVSTVIALGHSMGAHVVAEGIETAEQLATLRSLECDYGQGFYVCEPLVPADLEAFVQR
jgi:diguanylate cyclase (GGDEF)-like protein/PAS domain S-box-containing protein